MSASLFKALPLLLLAGFAALAACERVPAGVVAVQASATSCPSNQLRGDIYRIPLDTVRLPDFRSLHPVAFTCADRLAVAARDGMTGFPGVSDRFGDDARRDL